MHRGERGDLWTLKTADICPWLILLFNNGFAV